MEGKVLLELIRANPEKSAKQLAEMAGYGSIDTTGRRRVKMVAFQRAVLKANSIALGKAETKNGDKGRSGRKASGRMRVQQNGNLLINSAYTRQLGVEVGTTFEIIIGRKHITLVCARGNGSKK